MTKNQRKLYLVLHAVLQQVKGTLKHKGLQSKTRSSLKRISERVAKEMIALGEPTVADWRYFSRVADTLKRKWVDDEPIPIESFIALVWALLNDHRESLPENAVHAKKICSDIETMILTLYKHFDPDLEDNAAMDQGILIATEYRMMIAG